MESLITENSLLYWHIVRASGLNAYIFLFLSLISGIGLYTGLSYRFFKSERVLSAHKYIAVVSWAMICVHVLFLLFDPVLKFGFSEILIPFFVSGNAGLVLGIFGFYLFLFIITSSLFFRFKAPRFWRALHYLSYPTFFIVFLHGLIGGTDTNEFLIENLYLSTGIIASILVLYRILFGIFEKRYNYVVKNIYKSAPDAVILEIGRDDNGEIFKFKPGQYIVVSLPGKRKIFKKHCFSIASSPENRNYFRLGIRILGGFTKRISQIKKGGKIDIQGPYGDFIFDERKMKNVVFVAGGIGITPFMSAFEYAADKNIPNKMTLIYSNRTTSSAVFLKELNDFAAKNPNFKPHFIITDEKLNGQEGNNFYQGFVDEKLLKKILNNDFSGKIFFLCGPPKFMEIMNGILNKNGVKSKNIRRELFSL